MYTLALNIHTGKKQEEAKVHFIRQATTTTQTNRYGCKKTRQRCWLQLLLAQYEERLYRVVPYCCISSVDEGSNSAKCWAHNIIDNIININSWEENKSIRVIL
jgi:hypothetical protein